MCLYRNQYAGLEPISARAAESPKAYNTARALLFKQWLEDTSAEGVGVPPAPDVLGEGVEEGEVVGGELAGAGAEPEEVDPEVDGGSVPRAGPGLHEPEALLVGEGPEPGIECLVQGGVVGGAEAVGLVVVVLVLALGEADLFRI